MPVSRSDGLAGARGARSTIAVIGTGRRVGKTVVAAALAKVLSDRGLRVGVFKPVSFGCRRRIREGLVCPDAEFLAHCAEAPHDLATINPVRFARRFPPAAGGQQRSHHVDYEQIERCRQRITCESDLVLVEAAGGLLEPLDRDTRVADLLARWNTPLIVVAPAAANALNHVLMTLEVARQRGFQITAVVLNRYTADGSTLADETNPELVAAYGKVDLPVIVPNDPTTNPSRGSIGQDVLEAVTPLAKSLREEKVSG